MRRRIALLAATIILVFGAAPGAMALETQTVRKGVVRIICVGPTEAGTGTGFVINSSGNIVTNYHVIGPIIGGGLLKVITDDMAQELKPKLEEKFGGQIKESGGLVDDNLQAEIIKFLLDKLPDARVRWYDQEHDLAVLDCSAPGTVPLELTPSDNIKEGEPVYALGYPGKGDEVGVTAFLSLKVYNGVVASKESKSGNGERIYQTTAPFSGGNSGGPLVTECGSVIGITSFHIGQQVAGVEIGESLRYAIQIDELIPALKRQDIPFKTATGCAVPGPSSLTGFGVVLAVFLGLAALVTAASKRGRTAVKSAVGNTVHLLGPKPHSPAEVRQPLAVIRGIQGEYTGRVLPLDGGALMFGRDPQSCQIVFSQSLAGVSKQHCVLRTETGTGPIILEDLGSTNGTYVISGGKTARVNQGHPTVLNVNDRFCVGGMDNVFELQLSAASQPAAALAYASPKAGGFPQRMPVLKGMQGEYAGRTIPITSTVVIGRDPASCQVVFPEWASVVSKRHCSLAYNPATGGFVLEDLGSANGTFLIYGESKQRLQSRNARSIPPGSRFFIGDRAIVFEVVLE
ncbi:MAG TPA: FHA domain-containing protein [Blastocatellia bacterium]